MLFRRSTVFSVGVQTVAALLLIHLVGCASTGTPAEVSTFDTRALDYSGVVLEFVAPAAGSQDVHQRFRDETLGMDALIDLGNLEIRVESIDLNSLSIELSFLLSSNCSINLISVFPKS